MSRGLGLAIGGEPHARLRGPVRPHQDLTALLRGDERHRAAAVGGGFREILAMDAVVEAVRALPEAKDEFSFGELTESQGEERGQADPARAGDVNRVVT
jgi:hypothetical protein